MIPVHNRGELVGDAIASALAQTIRDLEVVVVDNASTDDTWSVVQDWAVRDSRVRPFRNERNVGPVRNWGRCFDEARGELGKLLFSDDLLEPAYLAEAMPWLEDPATGLVFSTTLIGESRDRADAYYTWKQASQTVSSSRYLDAAVPDRGLVPVSPGAGLFRLDDLRSSLRVAIPTRPEVDVGRLGAGPDVLLYLLTATRYSQVAFVKEPLAFFRAHAGSITLSNRGPVSEGYRLAYAWFADAYLRSPVRERALARLWIDGIVADGRWRPPGRALGDYVDPVNTALVGALGLPYLAKEIARRAMRRVRRRSLC